MISRAPIRCSFSGGGTDISPYPEERGGCVVSTTINKYATATLKPTVGKLTVINAKENETKLIHTVLKRLKRYGNVSLQSDIPPQSGLGNSASATVALLGLFLFNEQKNNIAELAYDIERRDLKNKGGKQDQYAAVFGGLNFIEFNGGSNVKVTPVKVKRKTELEKNLLLVNVGSRTRSGNIIQTYTHSKDILDASKKITLQVKKQLECGNLNEFGKLLHEAWEYKKLFTIHMTNPNLDSIYDTALKNGALGGKVMGAGNGGHMLFYCNNKKKVIKSLSKYNISIVDFKFENSGLVVKKL